MQVNIVFIVSFILMLLLYKTLLSNNRSFKFENIRKHIISAIMKVHTVSYFLIGLLVWNNYILQIGKIRHIQINKNRKEFLVIICRKLTVKLYKSFSLNVNNYKFINV
jgi:hypothetical protein